MDLGLEDNVALVTGAATGLGRAIAEVLAAEGVKVGVNYHTRPEAAQAVVHAIRAAGGTAVAVRADLTCDEEVSAMFDALEQAFGPVEVLVNNAAFCPTAPTTELPSDTFSHTLDVNMGGTFRCCREFVGRLLAIGRAGRIVNISSQSALRGSRSGKIAYDGSKAGVIGLTISLSRELAAKGFRVNCVTPGLMLTEMIADAVARDPDAFNNRVPMGRLAQTREIADVVVFLASERASYMTGTAVDVSGGLGAH